MNRAVVFAAFLLLAGALRSSAPFSRLALAPFEDLDCVSAQGGRSATAISSALDEKVAGMGDIQVRKSNTVSRYIDNLIRAQAGLMDSSAISAEAKGLHADAICLGSVSVAGGRYEVNQRIVALDSWEIIQSSGFGTDSLSYAVDAIILGIGSHISAARKQPTGKDALDRPTIAVTRSSDSVTAGGAAGLSAVFTEMLTSELGARSGIATLESKYVCLLIDEKVYEMSGVIQNDDLSPGLQERGADYLVTTELRRFKDMIGITCWIRGTYSGRTALVLYYEIGSPLGLRWAAESLSKAVEKALTGSIGTLKVDCAVPGYELYIDGMKTDARKDIPLEAGKYAVELKCRGYVPHNSDITIMAHKVSRLSVTLKKDETAGDAGDEDPERDNGLRWERRVWKGHK